MEGVLVRDHMGQHAGAGQPLLDRLGRLGWDGHMLLARPARILSANELADEKRGRNIVQLLTDLVREMGAKPATARAGSLLLREFNDDRHARQVLGESLATATLPSALRLRWTRGRNRGLFRRNRGIILTGEQAQLVRVDALTAGTIPLAEQEVHRMLQLLDTPLGLLECGGLLSNQLVAENDIVGEGNLGVLL